MTTPGAPAPDGAFVIDEGEWGQGHTEASVDQALTGNVRESLEKAVTGFAERRKIFYSAAEIRDGQLALNNRIDLLKGSSGHGSCVMSHNWRVNTLNVWKNLPYNTQLGPVDRVGITGHGLVLKSGGLWRVDLISAIEGYTLGLGSRINPVTGFLEFYNMFREIKPRYLIEVVSADGTLLTSRQHDSTPNPFYTEYAPPTRGLTGPHSTDFSHTFVLPEMPPEDDPTAPDHWVQVRASIMVLPSPSGFLSEVAATILGGTKLSCLTASRWSRDVAHVDTEEDVEDGGTL